MIRNADGTIHFSQLKLMSKSAAHYATACAESVEVTRAMRLGTAVHHILLGDRLGQRVVRAAFETRRDKGWKKFAEDWARAAELEKVSVELITEPEWLEAEAIAASVQNDPVVRKHKYLERAQKEVPLRWEANGLPCSTSGVDMIADGQFLGELKTTTNTEPHVWQRHAAKMQYHSQVAFYQDGARANNIEVPELVIIGVEVKKPYAVVVLELTEAQIDRGRRAYSLWLEKLRQCEITGQYPAYALAPVPFDVPDFGEEEDEDGEELDDEESAA